MSMNFGSVPKLCSSRWSGIVTEDSSGTLITSEYQCVVLVGEAQIKQKTCHVNFK